MIQEASTIHDAIEKYVIAAAEEAESQIDSQISSLNQLDTDTIDELRRRRIEQLRKKRKVETEWLQRGHGTYEEVFSEKEFFTSVKGEERVICHFFRENWPCKVVDKHLQILAKSHIETRFIKLNAEKAPFLVDRLKIWMLPTLALIQKGRCVDYIVGFDELGGRDDFSSQVLVERLLCREMLLSEKGGSLLPQRKGLWECKKSRSASDEDSDFD